MDKESENKINVTNRSSEYIRALEEMWNEKNMDHNDGY